MAFKILSVGGGRPNLIKIAAIWEAIKAHNAGKHEPEIEHFLLHTGQPEDAATCGFFFTISNESRSSIMKETGYTKNVHYQNCLRTKCVELSSRSQRASQLGTLFSRNGSEKSFTPIANGIKKT